MIQTHRVSMKFAKLKGANIGVFAGSAILSLTNNPAFPNLPVSLAELSASTDSFWSAFSNTMGGARLATALKNQARAKLVSQLRDTAHYVQIVAKNDLATLLSSGFTDIDRNTASAPLSKPLIRAVINQHSTQLWLRVKRVPNARMYQVRLKVGDGDYIDAGSYRQARKIVLQNLTPGTVYAIQVRGLGGSTDQGPWSGPTSIMAT